jgi:hypothetical protein
MALHVVKEGETPPDIELEKPDLDNEEMDETEEKLFLIPYLIGFLRWIEELIVALSGYGIVFALGVGVVDLLTDGSLTSQAPWVDYAYAIAFAAAIAGQIIGLASRSSRSFSKGQWLRGSAYTLLVILLAFTEYQASVIFGFHKAFGVPVATSLAQLGINQGQFIQLRAGVGVFLAVLSGFLRWQPTKRKSLAQIRKENAYNLSVAEERAKAQKAAIDRGAGLLGNAGKAARAALKAATSKEVETPVAAPSAEAAPPNE